MTRKLAIPLLIEPAVKEFNSLIMDYQEDLETFGTDVMFCIVEETTNEAYIVRLCRDTFNDIIESGRNVSTEEWQSEGQILLHHLVRLCAGEYLLVSSRPSITELNQEALLLWPGQPYRNFGEDIPVLIGAYHYILCTRQCCSIDIEDFSEFWDNGGDNARLLAEGINQIIENIPESQTDLSLISDEEYKHSDLAVIRLHDLYNAKHKIESKDGRICNVGLHDLKPTEKLIVKFVYDAEHPPSPDEIACGINRKNTSHFRQSLSDLKRLKVLDTAELGGYVLKSNAFMSGQKSGQSHDEVKADI